jgi:hypothetical protein
MTDLVEESIRNPRPTAVVETNRPSLNHIKILLTEERFIFTGNVSDERVYEHKSAPTI